MLREVHVNVSSMLQSRWWSWGFRSAVMLYFVVLILFPILGIYGQSLSSGWSAFAENITEPLAWKAVLLTIKLALVATAINMFVGTMSAWVLIRYRFPGRRLLNSLVDLPFALPTAVAGLMILLLLGPRSFVGEWAERLGFTILFHQPAIVIAMVFVTFPLSSGRTAAAGGDGRFRRGGRLHSGSDKGENVREGHLAQHASRHS